MVLLSVIGNILLLFNPPKTHSHRVIFDSALNFYSLLFSLEERLKSKWTTAMESFLGFPGKLPARVTTLNKLCTSCQLSSSFTGFQSSSVFPTNTVHYQMSSCPSSSDLLKQLRSSQTLRFSCTGWLTICHSCLRTFRAFSSIAPRLWTYSRSFWNSILLHRPSTSGSCNCVSLTQPLVSWKVWKKWNYYCNIN